MTVHDTAMRVRELFAKSKSFPHQVTFDFGLEGALSVNGATQPPTVSNGAIPSECTIVMSLADFDRMLAHDLDPQVAFVTGRLSVKGSLGVAINLVSLLET